MHFLLDTNVWIEVLKNRNILGLRVEDWSDGIA